MICFRRELIEWNVHLSRQRTSKLVAVMMRKVVAKIKYEELPGNHCFVSLLPLQVLRLFCLSHYFRLCIQCLPGGVLVSLTLANHKKYLTLLHYFTPCHTLQFWYYISVWLIQHELIELCLQLKTELFF